MHGSAAQWVVRELGNRLETRISVIVIAVTCAILTCGLAAFAGDWASSFLIGLERALVIAGALAAAGLWMWFPASRKPIVEPTRSLSAIALVLFSKQLVDPARLVVFASAAALAEATHAVKGGASGVAIALLLSWLWPRENASLLSAWPLKKIIGSVFILASALIVWIGYSYG